LADEMIFRLEQLCDKNNRVFLQTNLIAAGIHIARPKVTSIAVLTFQIQCSLFYRIHPSPRMLLHIVVADLGDFVRRPNQTKVCLTYILVSDCVFLTFEPRQEL